MMEPKEPTEEDMQAKCDEFAVKAGDDMSGEYWDLMLDLLVDENGQEN